MKHILVLSLVIIFFAFTFAYAQDIQQRKGFSIKLTEPKSQSFVFGKAKISAEVTIDDLKYLDRVEFYIGDKLIFVDREAPFQCYYNFGNVSKSHVIRAVAFHTEEVTVSDFVITQKLQVHYEEFVNRVILSATIIDKEDLFVKGLQKEDLTVYENGMPQKIIDFYTETRPITLALLIDTSGSMRDEMDEVHKAAGRFVDTLRTEDSALIIDFSEKVFLIQDISNDKSLLKESINSTTALGGTAIYDALHAAFRKLNKIEGRKAIILLSDGEDTESYIDYARVLNEAKASEVTIYSIGLGTSFTNAPNRSILKELAEETGGKAFFPSNASKLESVYESIADELRMQYYITYFSGISSWDGQWVKVSIEAKNKNYTVRTKKGFYAVKRSVLKEEGTEIRDEKEGKGEEEAPPEG